LSASPNGGWSPAAVNSEETYVFQDEYGLAGEDKLRPRLLFDELEGLRRTQLTGLFVQEHGPRKAAFDASRKILRCNGEELTMNLE